MGLVFTITAFGFFGCSTLPAPEEGSGTVFVLPVERVRYTEGGSTFGYYEVQLSRIGDDGFGKVIKVYAGSEMEIITGLPPGIYRISSIRFRYKGSDQTGELHELRIPFVLESGAITISPATIFMTIHKEDPDSRVLWIKGDIQQTSSWIRERVLEDLKQSENFSKWYVLDPEEARGEIFINK